MIREPAQAGNRASRTEHYLQWWENNPEWNAETSAMDKRHNSSFFCFGSCREPASAVLAVASLRPPVGGAGCAASFAKRPRNERSRATCRALFTAAHAIAFMRYIRRGSPFVSARLHFGRCCTRPVCPGAQLVECRATVVGVCLAIATHANSPRATPIGSHSRQITASRRPARNVMALRPWRSRRRVTHASRGSARALAAVARAVWHTAKILDGTHSGILRGRELNPGLPRDRRKY